MKLAVKKDGGQFHGLGGYHYMLHPMTMTDPEADMFSLMGYIVIEVEDKLGEQLLKDARTALHHQCKVALLAEEELKKLRR